MSERPRHKRRKLKLAFVTALMVLPVANAFCQTIEDLEKKYQASIATAEGKSYESLAAAEFSSDLGFMPECARRAGVSAGAVTIYYEVTAAGKVGNLYQYPGSVLADCIHDHLSTREFTAPPGPWLGKITLTISR